MTRRVLLLTTPEKGHLNPMAGVAHWLHRLGCHVGWLCIPEPAPELRALPVEVVPPARPLPRGPALVTKGPELARLVRDTAALADWIRTLLIDAVPGQVEPLRATIAAFRPGVVALDPMLYQGVIAAHLEGIPWAGISSSLNPVAPVLPTPLQETIRALAPARRELFARHGLDPQFRVCDCLSPQLNTVFATEALVGGAELPAATHLVGPSIAPAPRGDEPDFPWERISGDRPLVYASFGSQISWQPELFGKLAEATADLGVTLLCSAGDLAPRLDGGHVVAVPYVPQLALLAKARVLVTHGGANSVMEALHAGVPMLLSPVCNDQPHQAHFVARAGAGEVLDLDGAGVAACRDALARLLADDAPARLAVTRIAASYRSHDGARRTAEMIVAMR